MWATHIFPLLGPKELVNVARAGLHALAEPYLFTCYKKSFPNDALLAPGSTWLQRMESRLSCQLWEWGGDNQWPCQAHHTAIDIGVSNGYPSFEYGVLSQTRSPKSQDPVFLYSDGRIAPEGMGLNLLDKSPIVQILDDRWGHLYVLHESGLIWYRGRKVFLNENVNARMIATRGDALIFITKDGLLGPAPYFRPPQGERFEKVVSSHEFVVLLTDHGRVFSYCDEEPLSEVPIPEPSKDIIIALDSNTPAFAIGKSGKLYIFGIASIDNLDMLGLGGIDHIAECPEVDPVGETVVLRRPLVVSQGPFLKLVSMPSTVMGLTFSS